jgi:hypothetical protein
MLLPALCERSACVTDTHDSVLTATSARYATEKTLIVVSPAKIWRKGDL